MMWDKDREPVSKNRNSNGAFACAEQIYRSSWLSINLRSFRSDSLRLCHVSQLNRTLFTNKAVLSSRPTWVLYVPSDMSSNMALITEKLATAFASLKDFANPKPPPIVTGCQKRTPKLLELGTHNFDTMFTIPYVSYVTYHMSRVRCHVSRVRCHM